MMFDDGIAAKIALGQGRTSRGLELGRDPTNEGPKRGPPDGTNSTLKAQMTARMR